MLLRFLCSIKTFLNYVTDVYMYLKVTGDICDSQPHLARGETLIQVLDPFCSLLVKKGKSNRNVVFC